jgi:hypothetical protein
LARASRVFLYPASSGLLLAILAFGFVGPSISPPSSITPAGAVDYMVREKLQGNIYNYFGFGGYLIFRGVKTFIDGRTDQLFVGPFLANLHRILGEEPDGFIPLLEKYDVSVALVRPQSIESQELERSGHWTKVYSDDISWLYERQ